MENKQKVVDGQMYKGTDQRMVEWTYVQTENKKDNEKMNEHTNEQSQLVYITIYVILLLKLN